MHPRPKVGAAATEKGLRAAAACLTARRWPTRQLRVTASSFDQALKGASRAASQDSAARTD
eukprot:350621-Chlamydomonas_euryale.AAC.14